MSLLPKLDNGGFYYVLLGCVVTSLYFMVISRMGTSTSSSEIIYNHVPIKSYSYDELCGEKRVKNKNLSISKSSISNSKSNEEETEYEAWDDNEDLSVAFTCDNVDRTKRLAQRGLFYVIYNFVRAEKEFGCTDSITLSAPGDFRFLDNVIPLVDRWQGPISIALYAPGYDFYTTLDSIAYLRNCQSYLIRDLVTFHIVFDQQYTPKQRTNGTILLDSYKDYYNCSTPPPWKNVLDEDLFKTEKKLLYPINVVRNVAKLASTTYFIFPSDIELYPSRKFIPKFLQFVKDNIDLFNNKDRNVFALPIFEILEDQVVPENKNALIDMLEKETAIIFHQSVCPECHTVIDSDIWVKTEETEGLNVFSAGKRTDKYVVWEPFFVCTQQTPLWDERLTWEGQSNKMVQAYTLCVMNYDFYVLDNAFLIHKPGVKKKKVQMEKFNDIVKNSTQLMKTIAIELQEIYGYNSNCSTTHLKKKKVRRRPIKVKAKPII
ncbi:beta-1,4-glucuronyltransferase 1-like isoform X2 [Euwallacea similis]|uniref:beta-1,4-glucuronyltransferase 1-like isoform X2 n=1 Tax=Euwallacea similis TaxID=1736056 RepID=UPI00344BCE6C